jgi:hypothetical protein
MRSAAVYLFILSLFLFSCKHGQRQLIVGKWQAVKSESPSMDSFFANSKAFIDTIGNNKDDATNMKLYGTTNTDSVRQLLQLQYDSAKSMQMTQVLNTSFNFRQDSVVVISFGGALDSSKYHFNDKKQLVMAEMNNTNPMPGDTLVLDVLALTDTNLILKFELNGSSSKVTFHRETK